MSVVAGSGAPGRRDKAGGWGALAAPLGLSFLVDGAWARSSPPSGAGSAAIWAAVLLGDGPFNALLGVSIAVSGRVRRHLSIGVYVGLHILAAGCRRPSAAAPPPVSEAEAAGAAPRPPPSPPPHAELAKLRPPSPRKEAAPAALTATGG